MRWWHSGQIGPAGIGRRGQYLVAGVHPNFVGSRVGYFGAHRRVRDQFGPAKNYVCVECGEQAKHWAYDHADPEELISPDGLAYSAKVENYKAMCVPCHSRLDREGRVI